MKSVNDFSSGLLLSLFLSSSDWIRAAAGLVLLVRVKSESKVCLRASIGPADPLEELLSSCYSCVYLVSGANFDNEAFADNDYPFLKDIFGS